MNILIVAAHPDDEVLGCGATVARHAAAGDDVYTLILAEGSTSRSSGNNSSPATDNVAALQKAAAKAARTLGANRPKFLGLPDNRLDSLPLLDIVKSVENDLWELAPEIVYTHHGGDLNIDHRIAFNAVVTACRPLPSHSVRAIYSFETLSSTEWAVDNAGSSFRPNHFVDISGYLDQKIAALRHYEMEMREFPHPRSYEAVSSLAKLRGATVGKNAAEAFETVRTISADV